MYERKGNKIIYQYIYLLKWKRQIHTTQKHANRATLADFHGKMRQKNQFLSSL